MFGAVLLLTALVAFAAPGAASAGVYVNPGAGTVTATPVPPERWQPHHGGRDAYWFALVYGESEPCMSDGFSFLGTGAEATNANGTGGWSLIYPEDFGAPPQNAAYPPINAWYPITRENGEASTTSGLWVQSSCFLDPPLWQRRELFVYTIVFQDTPTDPGTGQGPGPGGGTPGGGQTGTSAEPQVDPDCQKKNFWGKDAAQRAELRRLAELFYLNAWDGQALAEDLDLLGLLLTAVAAQEGVTTDAAKGLLERARDLVFDEGRLANREADLELERRLNIAERRSAHERMAQARKDIAQAKADIIEKEKDLAEVKEKHRDKPGYKRRQRQLNEAKEALGAAKDALHAATTDFNRADAALSRVQHKLPKVRAELTKLRGNLGNTLTQLSRFLTDTEIGRALGNFIRIFNVAQDTAAAWMVVNAATAAILNNLARPPKGCDEGWTRKLPVPPGAASASAALNASGAGSRRKVPAAFGPVRAGLFLPRPQARAFNSALGLLGQQIRLAQAIERMTQGSAPKLPARTARKLARLLQKGPSHFRGLATAIQLPRLPVTAEALQQRTKARRVSDLRAELRRLGAGRDLITGLASPRGIAAANTVVEPFAFFTNSELDELPRLGAGALTGR